MGGLCLHTVVMMLAEMQRKDLIDAEKKWDVICKKHSVSDWTFVE